ncbi:hypothetical protein Tco_0937265 [Tanacetum coccineum]|uniref:Xylulose kinase-1 n=1 Tax=Tanacetum coccineum TaxID=301880 RepID=A0ABQ5DDR0_9ASTR
MSTPTFADTHNMVALWEKAAESNGFHEIIDFLNANLIRYALTVNPTIYTSCIQQFWATAKAKTVNGVRQIQALIDKKKLIITETSIMRDLHLEDAGGTNCLPTATIFEELAWIGRITPLFETMMVQPTQDEGVDSVTQEEPQQDDSVPTPSNDPPLCSEDNMQLSELMLLCTNLQKQVIDLEKAKDAQANEIADLKKRVQRLERKKKSRATGLKRLKKVGMSKRVKSSEDQESLGDHEDASKQGRSIKDIDKDADVSLVDDTQGRSNDADMFDIDDLHGDEVNVDMPIGDNQKLSVKEREVDTGVKDSAASTTIEEITLAQTLIQIKAAKPKFNSTRSTNFTIKYKGKGITIKLEVPLKRKDQVALDEDLARNLQAQLEAEIIEEEKLARKQEEKANIALIESWDNTQAMMEAYFKLAQRLQIEEQGEITIKERSRLFVELMNKRKKHFAMLRAEEKRRKQPTKAQKRNQMSTYLKNMVKSKMGTEESSKGAKDELEADKSKNAESSKEKAKGSRKKMLNRKREGKEQQQESLKRQRIEDDKDEHEEDDKAELKKHPVIVKDDEIAIDAIPLATKPPMIVEYKLLNEGIMIHY